MDRLRREGHRARVTAALLCLLVAACAPLISCAGVFTVLRPLPESPQSALDVAKQFERNYDYQRAYAAFSKILREPGSDHDHAEAEIGAAKALDGLQRKSEAEARLRAAAKTWAGTPEEPAVLYALAEMYNPYRESGVTRSEAWELWRRALEGYRRIAATSRSPRESVDAELGVADCLSEMNRRDEAVAGLEAAEKRLLGFHDRPRILLRLARFYDDERKLDAYRRIVSAYPGTPEAAESLVSQGSALKRLGRENEAIRVYEKASKELSGTEQGAHALLALGMHYEERDDRDRASGYYRKLVTEYPAGWMWPRMARSSLDQLQRYLFSPFYDKVMNRIQRGFVEGILHIDGLNPFGFSLAIALTEYVSHLWWLGVCLVLLALFARFVRPAEGPLLLRRRWTPPRLATFLLVLWTATLMTTVAGGSLLLTLPYWVSLNLEGATALLIAGAAIAFLLWKEPPRALFSVPLKSLWRTVRILAAGALVALVMMLTIHLFEVWLVATGHSSVASRLVPPGASSDRPWWYVVPYYLFFALAEECFYRGAVLQAFKTRTATWAAALLSSFLFAMNHMYSVWAAVWVFTFGMVMVGLVEKTKSLTPPTLVHAALNLFLFSIR